MTKVYHEIVQFALLNLKVRLWIRLNDWNERTDITNSIKDYMVQTPILSLNSLAQNLAVKYGDRLTKLEIIDKNEQGMSIDIEKKRSSVLDPDDDESEKAYDLLVNKKVKI